MELDELEKQLLENGSYTQNGVKYEIDDRGRVIVTRVDDSGEKLRGRPSIWGLVLDTGRIQWAQTAKGADDAARKITKRDKTTIGTYVSPAEYALIQDAAAMCGMTAGSFVRQISVKAAQLVVNDGIDSIDNLQITYI